MAKKESIFVFGAHSDDFVIGAGGTIAKYVQEKKKVISVVFSYGAKANPWLKEKVAEEMRSAECFKASKLLGCKTIFYDLKDFNFQEDYQKKKLEPQLLTLIKKHQPTKIFTHSNQDPHPDHRAVHHITLELLKKIKYKPEVYIYSIWNPVSFRIKYPSLIEDISQTFTKKIKALELFSSQRFQAIYPLSLLIFFRAIKNGLKIRKRFGEKFYRIQ